jgi:hypothetical protein
MKTMNYAARILKQWLSSTGAGILVITFFLPWLTFSCDNAPIKHKLHISGYEIASGNYPPMATQIVNFLEKTEQIQKGLRFLLAPNKQSQPQTPALSALVRELLTPQPSMWGILVGALLALLCAVWLGLGRGGTWLRIAGTLAICFALGCLLYQLVALPPIDPKFQPFISVSFGGYLLVVGFLSALVGMWLTVQKTS